MELVGERWSLLIARELLFGPLRFGSLRRGLKGISSNVLSQRLERLEMMGVIYRRQLSTPASVQAYELTQWGYKIEDAILSLGRWAVQSPNHDSSLPLSAASLMLSFKALYSPGKALGLEGTLAFRFGQETFVAHAGARLVVSRAEPLGDVIITSDPTSLAAVIYSSQEITSAEESGLIQISGDRCLAKRFFDLFELCGSA